MSPRRVAVHLVLKEVKRAEPLCFSASLANVTKREKALENGGIYQGTTAGVESRSILCIISEDALQAGSQLCEQT